MCVVQGDLLTNLPLCNRTHFPRTTNHGNKIGDLPVPPLTSMMRATVTEKLALHGAFRVQVGGRTPGLARNNLEISALHFCNCDCQWPSYDADSAMLKVEEGSNTAMTL